MEENLPLVALKEGDVVRYHHLDKSHYFMDMVLVQIRNDGVRVFSKPYLHLEKYYLYGKLDQEVLEFTPSSEILFTRLGNLDFRGINP